MKASALIEQLQTLISKHGDLEVGFNYDGVSAIAGGVIYEDCPPDYLEYIDDPKWVPEFFYIDRQPA